MADQAKAGWHPHGETSWLRWWDGKSWHDSYWPTRTPANVYMPGALRFDISIAGEPRFDIVGENWREAEILAAIGRTSTPRDVEFEGHGIAELVPEPDNPHDPSAIAVRIDGYTVGYLPSEVAPEYREPLGRLTASGVVPTTRVRVWGVTRWIASRGRDELKSAIRLALPNPDEILPANDIPAGPHYVIPPGRVVHVTGEESHLDVLSRYTRPRGAAVLASLHRIAGKAKSKANEVLEVRIDGARVGQLTPATSASLMPLVRECESVEHVPLAWAIVTGSRLAAEVKLRAVRAEEISDDWPNESATFPSLGASDTPPPAYRAQVPLDPPPSPRGLEPWMWVIAIIAALLLFAIPYVGWLLGLALIGASIWWHVARSKQPPRHSLSRSVLLSR